MELLRKAETLTEAYVLLDPDRPLEGEWFRHFYAERPDEASITPLIDELLLDPRDNDKTIFTGHRGSGKTTELARLKERLQPTHTVVRFSVESLLNLGDVNYADLLVVLGLQVFQAARQSGIELDEQRLHDLLFWYTTHVFEQGERGGLQSEVGGELNALIAKFNIKLTTDAPYRRETVRAQAQANLSDLLERLNALLDELHARSGHRLSLLGYDGGDAWWDIHPIVRPLLEERANELREAT